MKHGSKRKKGRGCERHLCIKEQKTDLLDYLFKDSHVPTLFPQSANTEYRLFT